jgi:hypothetical protein
MKGKEEEAEEIRIQLEQELQEAQEAQLNSPSSTRARKNSKKAVQKGKKSSPQAPQSSASSSSRVNRKSSHKDRHACLDTDDIVDRGADRQGKRRERRDINAISVSVHSGDDHRGDNNGNRDNHSNNPVRGSSHESR